MAPGFAAAPPELSPDCGLAPRLAGPRFWLKATIPDSATCLFRKGNEPADSPPRDSGRAPADVGRLVGLGPAPRPPIWVAVLFAPAPAPAAPARLMVALDPSGNGCMLARSRTGAVPEDSAVERREEELTPSLRSEVAPSRGVRLGASPPLATSGFREGGPLAERLSARFTFQPSTGRGRAERSPVVRGCEALL